MFKYNCIILTIISLTSGCVDSNRELHAIPSYRMLEYNLPKIEIKYDNKLSVLVGKPRTIQDFNHLQYKAKQEDIYSNYLLYLIYFDDSGCSLKKRIPDENCLLAIDYLNKTIELNSKFEPALHHLAILNEVGIGMDINLDNSIRYYKMLIDLNGVHREWAIECLIDIYLYNKTPIQNRLSKAKFYIDMGVKEDCFTCLMYQKNWLDTVRMQRYIHKVD